MLFDITVAQVEGVCKQISGIFYEIAPDPAFDVRR